MTSPGDEAAAPVSERLLRQAHHAVRESPLLDQTARSGWSLVQKGLRQRKIARHVGALGPGEPLRVLIGAGPHSRPGWLATDITPSRKDVVYVDATRPLPFATDSVDLVYTEHMIEHIPFEAGQRMLREIERVLRPGSGRVRISTPDFERVVALAVSADPEVTELMARANARHGSPPDAVFAVNRLFSSYGHQFLWSEELLRSELAAAGLRAVERQQVGRSDHAAFVGMEQHGGRITHAWNAYQSLIVEAAAR